MDQASAELILRLLQQDAQDAHRCPQNTSADDFIPGEHQAIVEWEKEIQGQLTLISDRKMAMSLQKASQDDGVAVSLLLLEEERAKADREAALRIAGRNDVPSPTESQLHTQSIHHLKNALGHLNYDPAWRPTLLQDPSFLADGAIEPGVHGEMPCSPQLECTCCTELHALQDMVQTPCSHYYCRECLKELCEKGLTNEALFPPRCCRTNIPLSIVHRVINSELIVRFEEKLIERDDMFKTYCSNRLCSKYILPEYVRGYIGSCKKCTQETCTICKAKAHEGVCVDRPDEALRLAQTEGWQQCSRCGHLVELTTGCYHISCRCRYEFCYVCGARWKTCNCKQWDERRLYDRAQEVAARNQQAPTADEIYRIAQQIRDDHDCDHEDRWVRIDGAFVCEECEQLMEEFILQCPLCRMRACVRCKLNVL